MVTLVKHDLEYILKQIRIAEEYLAPFGKVVRDKVMFRNALLFYRRHVPNEHEDD